MHLGRSKVHLFVQRQAHGGRDVGAILERFGRKSFVGYYGERALGEIITQAREKLFASFGAQAGRIDAGGSTYIVRDIKRPGKFSVNRSGEEVARGRLTATGASLETHDPAFTAIAPEVLLIVEFHEERASAR